METVTTTTTLIKSNEQEISTQIEKAVAELQTAGYTGFALSLAKAKVVEMISSALTGEVMKPIMAMQNKGYGFKTDCKTGDNYKVEVVRDCMIEATLKGVEVTGNQFNIIGGNCYITKNGCTHILHKRGIQHEVSFLLSKEENGVTVIPTTISWIKDGKPFSKTIEFPVKVYKGVTTEEAIRGKAERKIKSWLVEHLTGIIVGDGDVDRTVDGGYAEEVKENEIKTEPAAEEGKDEISAEDKKKQSDGDIYLSRAKNKKDLETRKDALLKQWDKYQLTKYNELLQTLPE